MSLREQFPVLNQPGERPLAFLDSAATTQKPAVVIDAMDQFYRQHYSSVKRGHYHLSAETTSKFERTRSQVAELFNAQTDEIVFTRGTTESINLVAWSWGLNNLKQDDEILISALEHHANIVPWQLVSKHTGAHIRVIPCDDQANLLVDELPQLLSQRTRMVALNQVANSTGTVNPIAEIIRQTREHSQALVLVDAAQSAAHLSIDVQKLDCDFLACSGHKMYGPTGIGMLYGKFNLLQDMPPWHGGGEMIRQVTHAHTTFADPPAKFEAGTPPVAEVIGLGVALQWLQQIGLDQIHQQESELLHLLQQRLQEIPGIRLVGQAQQQSGLQSFILEHPDHPGDSSQGIHAHDAAMILDEENIAVRSGHHCAQPVMDRLGVTATLRASLGVYSEAWEIERLISALQRVYRLFL